MAATVAILPLAPQPSGRRAQSGCPAPPRTRVRSHYQNPREPAAGLGRSTAPELRVPTPASARAAARTSPARVAVIATPRSCGSRLMATKTSRPITANSEKPPRLPSQLQPQADELMNIHAARPR